MTTRANLGRCSRLKALSRAASVSVILVGVLVLIGRAGDIVGFAIVFPGVTSMQAGPALAFVLCGITLWIRQDEQLDRPSQWIALLCAAAVTMLGLFMLPADGFGSVLGLDRRWFRETTGMFEPSRPMAPATALSFVLVGAALLFFDSETRRGHRPAPYLIVSASAVALLALIGHLYGIKVSDGFAATTSMPLDAVLSFLVLCGGLLFARPNRSFMGLVTNEWVGGMLLRRLLPMGLIGALVIVWLGVLGQRRNYYDTEFGVTLLIWLAMLFFVVVAVWSARMANRVDTERRDAESRYAGILEITPEAIIAVDESHRVLLFNKGAERIFGYRAEDVIGQSLDLLLPARFAAEHAQQIRGFAGAPESARRMGERREIFGRRRDGTEFPAEASIAKLVRDDKMTFTVILRDITERKRVEGQLRESERRFRQIAENIREVFWVSQPPVNRIIYVSPPYEEIWGRTCQSLYDSPRSWIDAIHPEDRERVEAIKKRGEGVSDDEYRVVRPDGAIRWVRDRAFPVKDEAGRVYRMAGIAEDVTQQKMQQEALEYQARYDALTGLANRAMLQDRLREAIAAAGAQGRSLALLLMDLDRFKEINDTLGHHRGDRLLQLIGPRLKSVLHDKDLVARLGGDEFAVLLPLAESRHASDVASKIIKAFEPPFDIEGLPIAVEASIGIAVCPDHGTSPEVLIQRADIAMYRTKQTGDYVIYDPRYDQHSPHRLAILGELRHAIEQHELMLYYQPKVDFKTRSVMGVEALVRWKHPYRGIILPDQFIGPAEHTGLIKPLTLWVLKAAQRQSSEWSEAGIDLPVSVNLSARHLHDTAFPSQFAELMRIGGGATDRFEVEITESAIMADPEHTLETITQLKALGIRFSIDDFGIGYSSLAYLKRLPVETIKIDKSFVMNMTHNANDAAIVRSTIDMAHHLDLTVVAEGIENEAIWGMVGAMGCDAAQGYYLSKPLPADEITQWVRESPWGLK